MPRRGKSGDCSECGGQGPASNGGHVGGCIYEPSPRGTDKDQRATSKKGKGVSRNKSPKRGRDPKGKFLAGDDAFDDLIGKDSNVYNHKTGSKCPICGGNRTHTHERPTGGGD